jgi:hypothetical protein
MGAASPSGRKAIRPGSDAYIAAARAIQADIADEYAKYGTI